MPDYLLNDITRGVLLLFVLWSVAVIWLMLGGFRYMMRQQKRIDALRAANETLQDDLAQCYARLPTQEWLDVLAFGDTPPKMEARP